ncbi:hypothetical protein VTN77DRAFT_8779 [Rasamsonia byssochlamydoides]|uniref:uncharacterized protein n=1 Tax=Rasamsonia byssochlamydoides TaxID=89139 RepID=UPI003743C761
MMPASPWFFTNLPGYNKNWLWRGDDLWYDRWQEILYNQPPFVEIISWNDYGESHYIGPLHDNAFAAFSIGQGPYNYAENMPHDGWRLFLPYVIDTYKNGIATITQEGLVTWYRLNPATACATGGTTGNTASQLQLEFKPYDVVQDEVFYSALLASPATVTVSIGGVVQAATWSDTPDGGIGIYHGSVPFNDNTGQVIVTISRAGETIASVYGASITTICTDGIENWNAWVGSDISLNDVSATPALTLAEQECIEGTGAYNFEGLCSFACYYGYCPVSACTFTAMGAPIPPPNATFPDGYPIAGEDASSLGLCSFDCTHGYYPDTACGPVEVPLVISTVSDFSPPACIGGTGEGNLAGLCNFSCQYGYCPIHSCTCTATGPLVPSPPTTGYTGYPLAGEDPGLYAGLCDFACSHGYCPSTACSTTQGLDIVYIDPGIWLEPNPVVACDPPCSFVMPPLPLGVPTTIPIPPYTTSVSLSYLTTGTSTLPDGSTTIVLIESTVIPIPPITTSVIAVWGVTISAGQTGPLTIEMTSSIDIPPITLAEYPNTQAASSTTLSPLTKTVTVPPYPWSQTTKDPSLNTKTTSWTSGAPSPLCTANCGHQCQAFCSGPCYFCPPFGISLGSGSNGGGSQTGGCTSLQTASICTEYISSYSTAGMTTTSVTTELTISLPDCLLRNQRMWSYANNRYNDNTDLRAMLSHSNNRTRLPVCPWSRRPYLLLNDRPVSVIFTTLPTATSTPTSTTTTSTIPSGGIPPPAPTALLVIAYEAELAAGGIDLGDFWLFFTPPIDGSWSPCSGSIGSEAAPSNVLDEVPFPSGTFNLGFDVDGMSGCSYSGTADAAGTLTCPALSAPVQCTEVAASGDILQCQTDDYDANIVLKVDCPWGFGA